MLLAQKISRRLNRDQICWLHPLVFTSFPIGGIANDTTFWNCPHDLHSCVGGEKETSEENSLTIRRSRLYRRTFVVLEIFYALPPIICPSNCLCIRIELFERSYTSFKVSLFLSYFWFIVRTALLISRDQRIFCFERMYVRVFFLRAAKRICANKVNENDWYFKKNWCFVRCMTNLFLYYRNNTRDRYIFFIMSLNHVKISRKNTWRYIIVYV